MCSIGFSKFYLFYESWFKIQKILKINKIDEKHEKMHSNATNLKKQENFKQKPFI